MHFGIDYGSKIAGTTVICYKKNGKLHLLQSEKKKDADAFLKQQIDSLKPSQIFIDAPLSLPAAYFQKETIAEPNFFFRKCDKELRAMSPMFLGGLTARAMKLKHNYLNSSTLFFETYPSFLVKTLFPDILVYKKKQAEIGDFLKLLQPILPLKLAKMPTNWHQVDGILAWLSGHRYLSGWALEIGEIEEGIITV
ncbi:MAG: putative nuclease with RNAse H fold [Paraglaciecola sp.]|jgi:predicted nuclease with RNAse H fold